MGPQAHKRHELAQIIADGGIRTLLQPIVCLRTARVIGFEALSRGPAGGCLENPVALFDFAEASGFLVALERLCRTKALQAKKALIPPGTILSLNIDPRVIVDPQFRSGITRLLLIHLDIDPGDIVLEITERAAIDDFRTFLAALQHYRQQGFRIAIDDVGAGYASLRTVIETRPHLLKIDASLVRGAAEDPLRREVLTALAGFSHRIGTKVVAEGVETAEDLDLLCRLDIDYAQGYFLARPAERPGMIDNVAQSIIREAGSRSKNRHAILIFRVGNRSRVPS